MPGPDATRYGYFGPEGTFTHQALLSLGPGVRNPVPYPTVAAALDAVRSEAVDAALVPIENSVEGGVTATLDNLTYGAPLGIAAEVLLPVQFNLYVRPGTALADIRAVLTHPHAAAQCRDWLAANLPQATVTEGGSTAAAAAEVARPGSNFDAAVCAPVAGDLHGLTAAASEIADTTDAVTRFVLVSRPGPLPPPTGADKTTLTLFMRVDRSGALLELLDQFASRGVNLTRIESRPTRTTLGNYCFSVDVEGHLTDARVAEALMGLHRICANVIFLGSYPRADATASLVRADTSNQAYQEARNWLDRLISP